MSRQSIDPVLREAVREELVRLVEHPTARARSGRAAPRRWVPVLTSLVVAALVGVVALVSLQHRTPQPATTSSTSRPIASPTRSTTDTTTEGVLSTSLGPVVLAGHPLSTATETIAASSGTVLYVATARSADDTTHFTLQRIDVRTGATTHRSISLDFLRGITVGPDGVYLSTSVIERFQQIPDTVLRLAPDTLKTLATRRFPSTALRGGVQLAARDQMLAVTRGDGSVETLDPKTLAVRHSVTLLDRTDQLNGIQLSAPVISAGRIWVLGADHGRRLVALDEHDLHRTSQTARLDADSYGSIAAAPGGVFVAGTQLASVDTAGDVRPLVSLGSPTLALSTTGTDAVIIPNSTSPAIDRYSIDGERLAHVPLDPDTGQVLAVGPHLIWVLGLPDAPAGVSAIAIEH